MMNKLIFIVMRCRSEEDPPTLIDPDTESEDEDDCDEDLPALLHPDTESEDEDD